MSTQPTLITNTRRRNATMGDRSEHYGLSNLHSYAKDANHIAWLLSEIEVLLAACTPKESQTFWSEFEQIKTKYRKPPELPVFNSQPLPFPPQPRCSAEQQDLSQPELPDFLIQRRKAYKQSLMSKKPSPELPNFLSKRSPRSSD